MKKPEIIEQIDIFCEGFGRAVANDGMSEKDRFEALSGHAKNLISVGGKIRDDAQLQQVFEKRVARIASLVPQTAAYAELRTTLTSHIG